MNLLNVAAECHREKWQFEQSDEYPYSKAELRQLVDRAFRVLHRIGNEAKTAHDGQDSSTVDTDHQESK